MKQAVAVILLLSLSGCTDMSDTQQRTLSGGLGGAAGGAVLGAIGGNAALGAVAGAAAGTIGGYLWDQHKKSEDAAYQQGVQAGKQSN
jgi:osmotically inducible lipoprotein OsmB